MHAGEACEFATDDVEDFDLAEPGHNHPKPANRGDRSAILAKRGTRAGAAIQNAFRFQIEQGSSGGRARDAETLHELRRAGQAPRGVILTGEDLAEQFAGDFSTCPESCNLYNNEGLPESPFRTDAW